MIKLRSTLGLLIVIIVGVVVLTQFDDQVKVRLRAEWTGGWAHIQWSSGKFTADQRKYGGKFDKTVTAYHGDLVVLVVDPEEEANEVTACRIEVVGSQGQQPPKITTTGNRMICSRIIP